MLHNIPAVIVNSKKPIALMRPGQKAPERDFEQVALEIDQGLVLTRMVVVNNAKEVAKLGRQIRMDGGTGNMVREVQRFSPSIKKAGLALIEASIPFLDASKAFGKKSGDVGDITSAGGVMLGQLGTPVDTVRYLPIMVDEKGQPLQGDKAYTFTVPAGLVEESGYFSMTAYGTDNRLLIPNARKVYAQTTYSAETNSDGSYTITLSPDGSGQNGIPTGKPLYAILRAYVPVQDADMAVEIQTQSPSSELSPANQSSGLRGMQGIDSSAGDHDFELVVQKLESIFSQEESSRLPALTIFIASKPMIWLKSGDPQTGQKPRLTSDPSVPVTLKYFSSPSI